MKRTVIILVPLLVLGAFKMSAQSEKQIYTPDYSANFKIGNAAYATKVLELWKDWDDNAFDRHDYFSDTVKMTFSDGTELKGKQALNEAAKKQRGMYTKVVSTIHAWIPLYSNDRNEDFVCIWGMDESTTADGKVEKKDLHEVWWFNKDGKVTMMLQWKANFGPPNP